MKIICLIFSFLSTNFSCKSSVQDNDNFKKIIIEWVGETDKPIKSIKINLPMMLRRNSKNNLQINMTGLKYIS